MPFDLREGERERWGESKKVFKHTSEIRSHFTSLFNYNNRRKIGAY